MATVDDARLRKVLWTLYWRGTAQLRERIEDELRRTVYGTFDATRHRRGERTDDLASWHEMLLERFTGTPEDGLLDRLVASPALAGPGRAFLRAKIAAARGDVAQAQALVTESLKELPGHTERQDFAVQVGAKLPPRAREMVAERRRILG